MIIKSRLEDCIPLYKHTWISLSGGGGKTTLMQILAEKYRSLGKTVLITTTTKIQSPDVYKWNCDYIFTCEDEICSFYPKQPCSVLFAQKSEIIGKIEAPSVELLKKISDKFDVVLCEADGSRKMPLKIHTERDPVIVDFNDWTICIIGSWAFGDKAKNVAFGISKDKEDCIVDTEFLDWYLKDIEGLLKGTESNKRCIVVTGSEKMTQEYIDFWNKTEERVFLL